MRVHHLGWLTTGAFLLALFNTAGAGSTQADLAGSRALFVSVPGEKEFSGQMISRPLPLAELEAQGHNRDQIRALRARARTEMARFSVVSYVLQTDEYIFRVPAGKSESQVASELLPLGCFQYVEPDWTVYPIACPNDTLFANQWHHQANRLQSCAGWDLQTGNPTVAVGICDTGVRTTHQDLQLHRLEGYNAVDQIWEGAGGNINPVHPHGTMTTGCAAANGNNGLGVSGMGWNLSHRMLRVSNLSSGSASLSVLQHAARTSVESGDRVASVSYSGVDANSNLTTATYIKSINGLLVWAAGNDNRNLTFGDRDSDDIIVAGGTDQTDAKASFSAFGQFVDVTAPAVGVVTTNAGSDSDYAGVNGTSFACPLTAGLCAMIWSADPSLTPNQVEALLKQSCDDLGSAGVDNTFGHGRINLSNAMTLATGGGGNPPVADFVGAPTTGIAPLSVNFSDLSTNAPTSWTWSFGDAGTSGVQNPAHVYSNPGTYSVSLLVTNADGSDSLLRTNYIVVDPAPGNPPIADFVGTPTSGTAPLLVNFTDLSTETPTSWSWNFGDGQTSTLQNPSSVYAAAGDYTVSLTVSNADGSDTMTLTNYISVSPSGGFQGQGFILSKNPDFSADDRVFSRTDRFYVLVWSDAVNVNDMRNQWWELRGGGRRARVRQNLTNIGDGSFTASFDLSDLPGSGSSYTFRARVEDRARVRFSPSTSITVQ